MKIQHLNYFDESTGKYSVNRTVDIERAHTGTSVHDVKIGSPGGGPGWICIEQNFNAKLADVDAYETFDFQSTSSGRFNISAIPEKLRSKNGSKTLVEQLFDWTTF